MINPVGNNLNIYDNLQLDKSNDISNDKRISFIELLKENINKVNQLQLDSAKLTTDFALGKADNVHQVMIAAEKASMALNLTIAIQNKVVDAYKEIMRIQV